MGGRGLALLSRPAMRQWLLEDLPCDRERLDRLDLAILRACLATGFKRRQLGTLLTVLARLQGEVLA
jgi:hypothetical protein